MSNLAVLFALYPRFYVIKSTYENSEYRFLGFRLPQKGGILLCLRWCAYGWDCFMEMVDGRQPENRGGERICRK